MAHKLYVRAILEQHEVVTLKFQLHQTQHQPVRQAPNIQPQPVAIQ